MDKLFDLPPLPEPEDGPMMNRHPYFTSDQMRAYARAAVEAEREACAREALASIDGFSPDSNWSSGYVQAVLDVAEGIRTRGKS